jgi:hypothetical protein
MIGVVILPLRTLVAPYSGHQRDWLHILNAITLNLYKLRSFEIKRKLQMDREKECLKTAQTFSLQMQLPKRLTHLGRRALFFYSQFWRVLIMLLYKLSHTFKINFQTLFISITYFNISIPLLNLHKTPSLDTNILFDF